MTDESANDAAPDIELPMTFYLGREYDLAKKKTLAQPVLYDARDLTTHGVIVGMTGSGKTGLGIGLLEEAAIDGVPCIIIDPKGDLTNLLLQFPDLDVKEFEKWLDPGEAKRKKMTPAEYAERMADVWRKGLADTYQTPDRIRLAKDSSDWRIYTPGSEAGFSLSILKNFAAPQGNILREQMNQRIDATATALLGLTGTAADPVQSREHILIAQILLHSWSQGRDLDLPQLINYIQYPPLSTVGAFDVETFFPEKDRLKLAIALNNILASPSFSTWINGDALDLSKMMYAPDGKPRQLIFYVAHLDDAQRMFFITLLLEEILNWTRKQPGATSLRALVYFDEVFGYLPPHPKNPPSKLPMLTMLKQARAFGVGMLLATQNPVDIDYKALSNAGTWFVGKLQTERDKDRLIEGLEGVAAEQGSLANRSFLDNVISSLGNRVFLYHNVHRGQPALFRTRHTLSFLRGPMTRDQVARLMKPIKEAAAKPESAGGETTCPECGKPVQTAWKLCPYCGAEVKPMARRVDDEFKKQLQTTTAKKAGPAVRSNAPPQVANDVPQYYLAVRNPVRPSNGVLLYRPRLYSEAEIVFTDRKYNLNCRRPYRMLVQAPTPDDEPAWQNGEWLEQSPTGQALAEGEWEDVPPVFRSQRALKGLENSFQIHLYNNAKLRLYENTKLELIGRPGEDIVAFQSRCRMAAEQRTQQEIEEEKRKYRSRFAKVGSVLPEDTPAQGQGGIVLFRAVKFLARVAFGNKIPTTSVRVTRLQDEWFARQAAIREEWHAVGEQADELIVQPYKKNTQVTEIGLAWVPYWRLETKEGVRLFPAYR